MCRGHDSKNSHKREHAMHSMDRYRAFEPQSCPEGNSDHIVDKGGAASNGPLCT